MIYRASAKNLTTGEVFKVGEIDLAETTEEARRMTNILLVSRGFEPMDFIRILEWVGPTWRGTVRPDA